MKKTVALCTLLAVLTACGGGGRPSVEEIAQGRQDSDDVAGTAPGAPHIDDDVIDCLAKVLHDSDASDEALRAMVDGSDDFEGRDEFERILSSEEFLAEDAKCFTG